MTYLVLENDQYFIVKSVWMQGTSANSVEYKIRNRHADERKMYTHKMNSKDSPKKILLSKRNLNQCHKKNILLKIYKTMISQEENILTSYIVFIF